MAVAKRAAGAFTREGDVGARSPHVNNGHDGLVNG